MEAVFRITDQQSQIIDIESALQRGVLFKARIVLHSQTLFDPEGGGS